jgi:hypothetical protein
MTPPAPAAAAAGHRIPLVDMVIPPIISSLEISKRCRVWLSARCTPLKGSQKEDGFLILGWCRVDATAPSLDETS